MATHEVGTVLVSKNDDLPSFPYTVRRMNEWGLSNGTLSASNPCDNARFALIEQRDGTNIYVPVEIKR